MSWAGGLRGRACIALRQAVLAVPPRVHPAVHAEEVKPTELRREHAGRDEPNLHAEQPESQEQTAAAPSRQCCTCCRAMFSVMLQVGGFTKQSALPTVGSVRSVS